MFKKLSSMVALPFFVCLAWADQVTLTNGDRVSGNIVKKDGGTLTFKSDAFGQISIPWEKVERLASEDLLTVVLPSGKTMLGRLTTSDSTLEIATPTERQSVVLAQVSAVRNTDEQRAYERLEHPGLLNLWTGYADAGLSLARGNAATTTTTTAFHASRETRADKTTLHLRQIYSTGELADGSTANTAKAVRGGWAYNRNLSDRLFFNLFNDYEYDKFQDLGLRFVLGGGLGYVAIKTESTRLDLLGGAAYNREKFFTPLLRHSAEAFWGDNLTHKISKATALTQTFRLFHNLTELGEYRINFDFGSVTNLNKWLAWQVTVSDRYLSNPVVGRKTNDVLLTTGIRVSFPKN